MYLIGLTGNIATGKSTVAGILAELGAYVIDADMIAHETMSPGTAVWRRIVKTFGRDIVAPDGRIDRAELGARVFGAPAELRRLERIVHPAVKREIHSHLRSLSERRQAGTVVVIEAIKLIESGLGEECDTVWVVISSRDRQIDRLMRTRSLSKAAAVMRIDAQPSQDDKVAHSDVVIENNGTLADLRARVMSEWGKLACAPFTGSGQGLADSIN